MRSEPASPADDSLDPVVGPLADSDPDDRDLLKRFVRAQGQAAFAALVQRHGPMV